MGSSPLTRGKPTTGTSRSSKPGLIPAHAGKTARSQPQRPRCRAHPRSRGENSTLLALSTWTDGSSPLTRGKLSRCAGSPSSQGLIPAHAGKTQLRADPCNMRTAHPRSRGENTVPSRSSVSRNGSSPLTRGKRDRRKIGIIDPGLIPAHAGKTFSIVIMRPH